MICDDIKKQIKLFKKYKDGRDLDIEDNKDVCILASIGMMKTGISLKRKQITAKTLPSGLKLLSEFD